MAVRVAVAFPTGGLLVGCIIGVFWPDAPTSLLLTLLIAAAILTFTAFWAGHRPLFASALVVCFAAGGTLLAVRQWQDAWRPTLKIAFESMARDERHELRKAGRVVPEEESAGVVVVGVLLSDAMPTSGGGISLNVATRWIGRLRSANERSDPAANPVSGGLLLTVAGALAANRQDDWRAGRTIRAPAQIRTPSFYLDPGVPDQQRVLARRGVALVGTVKSGALVEVESRGSRGPRSRRQFARSRDGPSPRRSGAGAGARPGSSPRS